MQIGKIYALPSNAFHKNAQNYVNDELQTSGKLPSDGVLRGFVLDWCVRLQEQKLGYYKTMADALRPNRGLWG